MLMIIPGRSENAHTRIFPIYTAVAPDRGTAFETTIGELIDDQAIVWIEIGKVAICDERELICQLNAPLFFQTIESLSFE
ncbi:MAG TPA: hypothetical protein V6C72_11360 [Chroococcales cyanobacterium]